MILSVRLGPREETALARLVTYLSARHRGARRITRSAVVRRLLRRAAPETKENEGGKTK